MKKKSKYKRKRSLNGTATAKSTVNNAKASAIQTGKELLIGVIGGGIAGAIIGKPSLLIGAVVTGYGHYSNKPTLSTFGIGMMASSGFTNAHATQGIDGFSADEIQARVLNFKDSLSAKLFLDNLSMSKTNNSTNGVGAVQYYQYPHAPAKELDFTALDQLHEQVVQSGINYTNNAKTTALNTASASETTTPINGNDEDEMEFATPSY